MALTPEDSFLILADDGHITIHHYPCNTDVSTDHQRATFGEVRNLIAFHQARCKGTRHPLVWDR